MRRLCVLLVAGLVLGACGGGSDPLETAEEFVDAFYSYDPAALEDALESAESSQPSILFYQGWAEGANYRVVDRMACTPNLEDRVECAITVEDDLIKALNIDFNVTDKFFLSFTDGEIVSVRTSSNDPEAIGQAFEWVFENEPALFEPGGSCDGFFDGGPTPGECAVAVVAGFQQFAAESG